MVNKLKYSIVCLAMAGILGGCQMMHSSKQENSTETHEKQTLIIEETETETETETEVRPKIENLDAGFYKKDKKYNFLLPLTLD